VCSTFKVPAAPLVLARADRNRENLTRCLIFEEHYLVPYSPIVKTHVGDNGMTIGQICEAAMTVRDNSAGNLMLDSFGQPTELTAWIRSLDDNVTRLDRRENRN